MREPVGRDSAADALIFDVRFPDNSFPPQGELPTQVPTFISRAYQEGPDKAGSRPGLPIPQQFPLQINDLPNAVVSVAGAGEKRAEPGRGIGALSLVRRRPVLVGLSFGRRDRDSNRVIECS